jgi:predicted nucleic acid-binding protein
MTFADIPAGAAVFPDANTLVSHFGAHPVLGPPCKQLLDRIENKDFEGFTSAAALSDMAHRLMTAEAITRFGWPQQGIPLKLKNHPAEVQQLHRYRNTTDELSLVGLNVLPTTGRLVSLAADISLQTGLLSGDALIVSTMRESGLTHLASNDADFDRVPGLTRYAPV